ncbi:concanavalin A-like lectin/glucanase domain-containing protein [Chaetomium sp. MPI-SDFR-AT-0129]|nr:concanavalin A-like lectin/glucanase domain-containing protein [Chaetomium sp. MPI-SDFR-AT-0129]
MQWALITLLSSAIAVLASPTHTANRTLTFTIEATQHGKPIPPSQIKLEPFEFGRSHIGHHGPVPAPPSSPEAVDPTPRMAKRANPTATSNNWCGSVNTLSKTNPVKTIHGEFQHPTCSLRGGSTTFPQAAANWVGIDGDSWTSALLQAGTVCKIDNSTGIVKNEVWWQWVPSAAYTITSMPVSPDDWFEITIATSSATSAEITITNLAQAHTYTITINSGPTLARVNADWVVERPYFGTTLAGFPTFTDVWFDNAWADLISGARVNVDGAKQYQIPGLCASQEWDGVQEVSWSL